jgi:hypothetical protein
VLRLELLRRSHSNNSPYNEIPSAIAIVVTRGILMPFTGTGGFNLVSGNPVVTGTNISSTVQNNTMSDFANGFANCITRDGQSTPTANLPMGNQRHTGAGSATGPGEYLVYGQALNGSSATITGLTKMQGQTVVYARTSAALTVAGDFTTYTEVIDRNGDFTPATGIFIAPVTAVYLVSVRMECVITGTPGFIQCVMDVKVNGTTDFSRTATCYIGTIASGGGVGNSVTLTIPLSFNAADSVKCTLTAVGGSGSGVLASARVQNLSIVLIG